jgi:signal transduction histidine kinase
VYQNFFKLLTLITLSFSFLVQEAEGQEQSKIDSLKQVLTSVEGKSKYEVLFGLFVQHLDKDNQEALKYARESLVQATLIGDSLSIVKANRAEGYALGKIGQNDEGIRVFIRALKIAERNNYADQVKFLLNNIALAYTYQANYDKALDFHFKSLVIREAGGNKSEISITKNNIGIVYYRLKDFEMALDYYQQSLNTKKEIGDTYDLDRTLINIALCYQQLRNYEMVPGYIKEAFNVCQPNCSESTLMEGHTALGNAYLMMKDFEQASLEFTTAYEKARQLQDVRFMAENLWGFSRVSYEQNNLVESVSYLTQAEELMDSTNYREDLIRIYRSFADVYTTTKDFEKASLYQNKYIQLKDSVYSEQLIKNLARVQTDYEERENIKTIGQQNENIRLKEEVIARQKQVYFFIAALAILSIGMAFAFFIYNRAISRAKAEVTMLNETLELKVEERTKALQSVNNELDNFIYKTSHDIRGPLASLKGIANVALMELEDPKAKDYLRKLDNSADKLNSILTRLLIVNQINHAVLAPQKIDFDELINEILVFERKKGVPMSMKISAEVDPDAILITDRHLLRIILENLVDNAIKYHNNSQRIEPFVMIKVGKFGDDEIVIKVIDNGIGIMERDPQKLFQMFVRASERSESGGIGLYLTKLASERLEAKIDFATTADKFTQFSVLLPADLIKVLSQKDNAIKKA